MGGGASIEVSKDEQFTRNSPVRYGDISMDGRLQYSSPNDRNQRTRRTIKSLEQEEEKIRTPAREQEKLQQAALEAQASAHWYRIISHSRRESRGGAETYTFRCRDCLSENETATCEVCGNIKSPQRVVWNHRTQKFDRTPEKEVLDGVIEEPSELAVLSGEADNFSSQMRAANILRQTLSPPRRASAIVEMGAKMVEEELRVKAGQASSAARSSATAASKAEKRQLAEQILGSLREYDELQASKKEGGSSSPTTTRSTGAVETLSEESKKLVLPELIVSLKSRTATTITLAWDQSSEAILALSKLVNNKGSPAVCRYHAVYQPHLGAGDLDSSAAAKKQWKTLCYSISETAAVAADLQPNTKYVFKCRRLGWDTWCSPVVVRSGPGVPSQPLSLLAKEIAASSVIITWGIPEKDNGLPVLGYTLRMKSYKEGSMAVVYSGKDRLFLCTGLACNTVYIFEVAANNKAGEGVSTAKYAVRTLAEGAAALTPWAEAIDDRSGKIYYLHIKSNAVAWTLPKGALIDEAASFKRKKDWLYARTVARSEELRRTEGLVDSMGQVLYRVNKIAVNRNNLMEDSLAFLHRAVSTDMAAGPIRVEYLNEEGVDAGGLAKDWFQALMRKIIEGPAGLLRSSAGVVHIDPRASDIHGGDTRWIFKAIGVLIAKAILDAQILGVSFSPLLLILLRGAQPILEDLKDSDPEFYSGLTWIQLNDVSATDLTFSVSYEGIYGESKTIALGGYNESVKVTEDNKEQYIDLMIDWLCRTRFEPCLSYLLSGFNSVMNAGDLQHFKNSEVQMLLGGKAEVDVDELSRNALYMGGYASESPQVRWFWQYLEQTDQECLSKILVFSTGCSCLPVDGLNPPFTIMRSLEAEIDGVASPTVEAIDTLNQSLPRSHTCFNQLVLPPYSSFEVLKDRLEYALENSGTGFYIA